MSTTAGIHTSKPKTHKAIVEKGSRMLTYPLRSTSKFHFIMSTSRFWRFIDAGNSVQDLIAEHKTKTTRRWRVVETSTALIAEEG